MRFVRAGTLKTRKYKVRRKRGCAGFLLIVLLALIALGLYLYCSGNLILPIPLQPSPTLTPQESETASVLFTLPIRILVRPANGLSFHEAGGR